MNVEIVITFCSLILDLQCLPPNGIVKVKPLPHNLDFEQPCERKLLKTLWGKRENTGYQHFLLFPQCFLPFLFQISLSLGHIYSLVWKCFQFGPVQILSFSKGLKQSRSEFSLQTMPCKSQA